MKKYWLFALLILAAVIGVVLTSKPTQNSAALSSTGIPPVMETIPRQAGRLPYTPSSDGDPSPSDSVASEANKLAPFLSAPITLQDGGIDQKFELATDQLYLRGRDAASSLLQIPQTNTPAAFAAAIEKVRADHGSEPELVLYTIGFPRNEYTRRIVTREVVVNASTRAEADVLAAAQGLVFQEAPVFAPNAFVYEAPTSAAALGVLTRQEVASADATPLLASLAAKKTMPNDPFVPLQWHLKYQYQQGAVAGTDINVESVWNYPSVSAGNYTRGGNVTIGIVDDGLEWSHPDLARNMRNDLNWDWNGKDNDPKPSPGDDHGTACAGVAAARGNNRIGVSGVAPEASLVGMRLISGAKTDLDEAEAMNWWLVSEKYTDTNANGKKDDAEPFEDTNANGIWDDAIHIKSNSWGPSDNGFTLEAPRPLMAAALKYAADFGRDGKGSIITFAGGNGRNVIPGRQLGNDNSNYDGYANSIYTIAVAAMNSDGLQSSYSESGANLIVSAPSNGGQLGIMTTDNKGRYGYNKGLSGFDIYGRPDFASSGDVTKTFGGTSSACPTVSGVIALMLDKNPDLGWRDVQEILIRTAKKIDHLPDDASTGWISANRTDHVTGNATVPFHFNHKYGAGLVDAAKAVALSGNWTNLGPQKSKKRPPNEALPLSIAPGATENRTFTVNGDDLRLEHVTLRLTIEDIKKGDLEIKLTSPNGTSSVFCEPHDDRIRCNDANGDPKGFVDWNLNGIREDAEPFVDKNKNGSYDEGELYTDINRNGRWDSKDAEITFDPNEFKNWTFMTVRNWGESSSGNWTLSITNRGATAGNLTEAELVVFGTDSDALVDAPVVTLAASRTKVFVGSNLTLTATAKDRNNDRIENVEAYEGVNSLGVSANGTWTIQANKAGNYTFTVNATDSQSATATSTAITIQVHEAPIAAWDFDTTSQSPIPIATAVQSVRKYAANFGSGNMTFNGSFDGDVTNSNRWEYGQGQIVTADGTAVNAVANMESGTSNKALLLRGGKNIGAEGKSIVFEFSMAGQENLNVSYAAAALSGGFTTHTWSYSSNGTFWTDLQAVTPGAGYSSCTLNQTTVLNNSTSAYLRLQVSGSTAASGQNWIDNIILSTSPITAPVVSDPFTVISKNVFKASLSRPPSKPAAPSPSKPAAPSGLAVSQPATSQKATEQNLDWVAPKGGAYSMVVHAEVVDGAKFLNAPGSLLSANEDGKVLGLAEPILQSTSYKLEISSTDSAPQPLRLKVYDSKSKSILVLEEKVPFAPRSTIGTPSTPKRYKVAYQEAEQVVRILPGWNSFTTAVDLDTATFEGVFSGYDYREGDQLVGPNFKATVVDGKWSPSGLKFVPRATYSLLRQAPTTSQIILKGKEVNSSHLEPVNPPLSVPSQYGQWISLPPGAITTADWVDSDQDGIDDRRQIAPGQPVPQQKKTKSSPASANPSGSQGRAPANPPASSEKSSQKSKALKKSKPSQKSKSLKSNKKNSGKKKTL